MSAPRQVWTHMDLFSTSLELAGIAVPSDRVVDGMPLARALANTDQEVLR